MLRADHERPGLQTGTVNGAVERVRAGRRRGDGEGVVFDVSVVDGNHEGAGDSPEAMTCVSPVLVRKKLTLPFNFKGTVIAEPDTAQLGVVQKPIELGSSTTPA